jgi:hypothetical protein
MGKAYEPGELAYRAFIITSVSVSLFIACVFIFIL